MPEFDLPSYTKFLTAELLGKLWDNAEDVDGIEGFRVAAGLREKFPQIETEEALAFVAELYAETKGSLNRVLEQREIDREFMDRGTLACVVRNTGIDYSSPEYETVIGKRDESGRIVIGSLAETAEPAPVEIPEFLVGDQVTLFGPPDTAKMAINAMNAFNRVSPDEPAVVTELAEAAGQVPRWGADNEDSKTPIMASFLSACENLVGCFDGTLQFEDAKRGITYKLDETGLSKPIKRIPGLALPDGSHLVDRNPLPLHLFDFAMHLWHNRSRPEALVFYVPKLENEEEAAYLKELIDRAESKIQAVEPSYQLGTVKLFIVFENPRAIFRIREITLLHSIRISSAEALGGTIFWRLRRGSLSTILTTGSR